MNRHSIPLDNRKGLALREMTPAQKHLADALLCAGLSQQGVIKAHTIMSLEQILKDQGYFVSIFGEPSDFGSWGYRFEGGHISLNFAVVKGRVASSPSFFGANPEEVKEGPREGLRALKREEDLGCELKAALSVHARITSYRRFVGQVANLRAIVNRAGPGGLATCPTFRGDFEAGHL